MKKILTIISVLLISIPIFAQHCGGCPQGKKETVEEKQLNIVKLTKAKQLIPLSENYFISYEWNKRPKIGNYILAVQVYDSNKKPINNVEITADAYMPSMKGAHDTGDVAMKMNKKEKYVIPVHFMMLGDWEILLKVNTPDSQTHAAVINLDI
jgi:hypothetical protein